MTVIRRLFALALIVPLVALAMVAIVTAIVWLPLMWALGGPTPKGDLGAPGAIMIPFARFWYWVAGLEFDPNEW